jgi:hypothetical protein
MSIRGTDLFFTVVVAALCALAPEFAVACSCKAHFEIVDPTSESCRPVPGASGYYDCFKPDVPTQHFEAHQTRQKGETDNACRRLAREAAQSCMSGLWRDRFINVPGGDPLAAPECRRSLSEITEVIRPSVVTNDLKRDLERAACCGESPWQSKIEFRARIYKRTHGDSGCGPNLKTVESRFLSDYVFDCRSVRVRESCGSVELTSAGAERGYDRPGLDLPGMPIPDVTSPANCRTRCIKEHDCRAWTWVRPGIQGPAANCWLKSGVPWAKRNDCCSSGVVR